MSECRCRRPECRADLPPAHPGPVYVARAGALCVDAGCRLQDFVEDLCGAWQAGGCDVAVWMHAEGVCRLVAVLRTGPGGGPLVTWL